MFRYIVFDYMCFKCDVSQIRAQLFKAMMSLVNDSLKFTSSDMQIC